MKNLTYELWKDNDQILADVVFHYNTIFEDTTMEDEITLMNVFISTGRLATRLIREELAVRDEFY